MKISMLSDINIKVQRSCMRQFQNNSISGNKYLIHIPNKRKLGTDHIFNARAFDAPYYIYIYISS